MAKRSPRLALRQRCTLDLMRGWAPGRFLEVGAGVGYMTRLFLDHGYSGVSYDPDPTSREHFRRNLAAYGSRITVVDQLDKLMESSFDYLLAFEVLEHIPDDRAALADWSRYLKADGRLFVSVPAHRKKFGPSDERVGHIRRYDRRDLTQLLSETGFKVGRLVNYGFPLTEVSRRLSDWIVRRSSEGQEKDAVERSMQSSYTRPQAASKALALVSEGMYIPFASIQRAFYSLDFGDGILVDAVKSRPMPSDIFG